MRVHLDPVILATSLIRWFESAVIGGAVEGEQFIKSISKTLESTPPAIHSTVATCLAAILLVFTNDLLGNFNKTIKDVGERTAKLAGRSVSRARRSLDISHDTCAGDNQGYSNRNKLFHSVYILEEAADGGNGKMEFLPLSGSSQLGLGPLVLAWRGNTLGEQRVKIPSRGSIRNTYSGLSGIRIDRNQGCRFLTALIKSSIGLLVFIVI